MADCLSSRTQRQLQFYFLSNCNCSPLICKTNWILSVFRHLRLEIQNYVDVFKMPSCLIYCLCFGVSLAQYIAFIRSVQNAFTVKCEQCFTQPLLPNDLLSHSSHSLLSHSSLPYRALIENAPDSGVSRDQPELGSLLQRVREGSGSREPGWRGLSWCY